MSWLLLTFLMQVDWCLLPYRHCNTSAMTGIASGFALYQGATHGAYHLHDLQALSGLLLIRFACEAGDHCHLQLANVLFKGITAEDHSKYSSRVQHLLILKASFAILVISAVQMPLLAC